MAGVKVYDTGLGGFASGSWLAVSFGSELWDDSGFHSTVTNLSRLTIPAGAGGRYIIQGGFEWDDGNTTGNRGIAVRKNGGTYIDWEYNKAASIPHAMEITAYDNAAAGDYYELMVYQDTGSSLFNNQNPHFGLEKIN